MTLKRALACAILMAAAATAGTMMAWGSDADGRLGNGAAAAEEVAGGSDYSVALVTSP